MCKCLGSASSKCSRRDITISQVFFNERKLAKAVDIVVTDLKVEGERRKNKHKSQGAGREFRWRKKERWKRNGKRGKEKDPCDK